MALKRKSVARGKRALRAPSIVDGFSRLPSPASVAGSVVPGDCPLVAVVARGLPATIREDGQNDSMFATTPDVNDSPSS
jgi:hypothetical protein